MKGCKYVCEVGGKCLTKIAPIEGVLCIRAKCTEARSPSGGFLVHRCIVRAGTAWPGPSCKNVWDEDLRRSGFCVSLHARGALIASSWYSCWLYISNNLQTVLRLASKGRDQLSI